jgi:molybdopterin molybdotransferase
LKFDQIIAVDWSSSSTPSSVKPVSNAIYVGSKVFGQQVDVKYFRTRASAMDALCAMLDEAQNAHARVLVGFDFGFGYPRGFAHALTGQPFAFGVWDWLAERIEDGPDNRNNRFEVADQINQALDSRGPFWGCPKGSETDALRQRGSDRDILQFPERRMVETLTSSAQPMWKLYTPGSVGGQSLVGLPMLVKLRRRYGRNIQVWPFETFFAEPTVNIVLAEIYPSLFDATHRLSDERTIFDVLDARQVRAVCEALENSDLGTLFSAGFNQVADAEDAQIACEEGWILGVQKPNVDSGRLTPPPLGNDCFAMPQGVSWAPVDEALDQLKQRVRAVTGIETVAVKDAVGRYLASDIIAQRANPPHANCAVDGYGFLADAISDGPNELPVVMGRAAAGMPFSGAVPKGHAIRILTGAILPSGVDMVMLEEDCTVEADENGKPLRVAFHGGLRKGLNTRKAGEDVMKGDVMLRAARKITPADAAFLTAGGISDIDVRAPLRVAVISTGDELVEAGSTAQVGQIFDANRPMLLSIIAAWGFEPVDMGIIRDDPDALKEALDEAARSADAILTSGGASAGDEDHVSKLLRSSGSLAWWRIAVKPGRPLALAMWDGVPVFGLPGNPVAAFVCTAIFARPAMTCLAGGDFEAPQAVTVPAGFSKRKKEGRREFLRARLRDGIAEVFASEGSGRIGGLSWAEGLVELPDEAQEITLGTPVRYIPFASLGL